MEKLINIEINYNIDLFIFIINKLSSLFELLDGEFFIKNNFIRHILINKNEKNNWNNDIIIYTNYENEIFIIKYINDLEKILKSQNIKIELREKYFIKFILNINDLNFTIILKKRNVQYDYIFEINQIEYNIQKKILINIKTQKTYNFIEFNIIENLKNELLIFNSEPELFKIIEKNPLIIFELIELDFVYPFLKFQTEINNILLNFNTLLKTDKKFIKLIKKIFTNDNELIFYGKIINFAHYLEEINTYSLYIKYLMSNYNIFINIISGLKINIIIYELFDNNYFKDFICGLIYQYLFYKKKEIYKIKKPHNKNDLDLLDVFLSNNEINNEIQNETNDNFTNDINLLDKSKYYSLKILKELSKSYTKFENLINILPLNCDEQKYIKIFYNINIILYSELKNIKTHHYLKLAYIIKKFHFAPKELLKQIIYIFNNIIKLKSLDNFYLINDNFLNMINSQILNNYIFQKMTNIPKIKKNFENELDCIDIIDYQDAFILFIEFIYKNKSYYVEDDITLIDFFDSIFDSIICDMRSYRILQNEKRRKNEIKEKDKKKSKSKSKYKIVKSIGMNILPENDIEKIDNVNNIND